MLPAIRPLSQKHVTAVCRVRKGLSLSLDETRALLQSAYTQRRN